MTRDRSSLERGSQTHVDRIAQELHRVLPGGVQVSPAQIGWFMVLALGTGTPTEDGWDQGIQ